MARVEIHDEVGTGEPDDWNLSFQRCTYHYDDGSAEDGYRFIWRTLDGSVSGCLVSFCPLTAHVRLSLTPSDPQEPAL